VQVVARLADGVSAEAAQASLDVVQSRWQDEFSGWVASNDLDRFRFVVSEDWRYSPGEGERIGRMLGYLAATVFTLLLIGCANLGFFCWLGHRCGVANSPCGRLSAPADCGCSVRCSRRACCWPWSASPSGL
jgi:hypothetical protein